MPCHGIMANIRTNSNSGFMMKNAVQRAFGVVAKGIMPAVMKDHDLLRDILKVWQLNYDAWLGVDNDHDYGTARMAQKYGHLLSDGLLMPLLQEARTRAEAGSPILRSFFTVVDLAADRYMRKTGRILEKDEGFHINMYPDLRR